MGMRVAVFSSSKLDAARHVTWSPELSLVAHVITYTRSYDHTSASIQTMIELHRSENAGVRDKGSSY